MNWVAFGEKEEKEAFSRQVTTGYTGGLLISFPLKNNYHVVSEGSYSQKGRRWKYNNDQLINKATYQFVDLTMLLRKSYKFQLRKNVPAEYFFNIGPEVNYWINGKGNAGGYDYTLIFNKPADGSLDKIFVTDANRWLFGIALGTGFSAPLRNNQKINVEFRFVSGHTFLSKKKGFDPNNYPVLGHTDTFKINMKVVTVTVAYTLDLDVIESRKGKSTLDKKIKRKR